MHRREILEILGAVGAIITDSHIVYTSERHGEAYVNKDALYPHTAKTSCLCQAMAQEFRADGIETVIAPAIGGVILSQWVAHHLSIMAGREVFGVYAEKEAIMASEPGEVVAVPIGERFVIKRGYDRFITGKRVLVVEDVLTTGGSVKKVVEAVCAAGGTVVGVSALCNRGALTAEILGVPRLESLINIDLESWPEAECPLCTQGIPVNTEVGKGKDFLARRKS